MRKCLQLIIEVFIKIPIQSLMRIWLAHISLILTQVICIASSPPNVVLINVDDQGYGDLGCTGNELIQTPHIDQLYAESVHFTNYHVNSVCSPSRAALMSGQNAARVGVWHTLGGKEIMRADVTLMPEYFRRAGYATMMVGKWHNGDNYPFRPEDRGFEKVYRIGGGSPGQVPDYWGNGIFDTHYWNGRSWQSSDGFCTDVQFDASMDYIRENKNKPFFLYLATTAVHSPVGAPDAYLDLYPQLEKRVRAFYAMVTNLDTNVGRLRTFLEQEGISDNTIFIYTTDNGSACDKNNQYNLFNGNMSGKKGSTYDGGHRVPLFIHWPAAGIDSPQDIGELVAHYDLLPTFADACGFDLPADAELDGQSLLPLLKGKTGAFDNRVVIVESKVNKRNVPYTSSAILKGPWRLINNGRELYDVQSDPLQELDVSKEHPELIESLRESYDSWYESVSPRFDDEVRVIIGTPNLANELLNCMDVCAREGESNGKQVWNQGGVSNGSMYQGIWKLKVATAGEYTFKLRRFPPESGLAFDAVPHKGKKVLFSEAQFKAGPHGLKKAVNMSAESVDFTVVLETGPLDLDACLIDSKGQATSAYYIEVQRN